MRGLLIVNTGTPKSKDRKDVKFFIGEMLSDPLVMSSVPSWFRTILAKGIIAPLRASNSASHYSLIWDNEHEMSPLMYNTRLLSEKVEIASGLPVEFAMRYGEPSILEALDNLKKKCPALHEVVAIPMFPQYAQSSYQTVVDELGKCYLSKHRSYRLKIVEPFYKHIGYIKSLSERLKPFVEKEYDRLIFSFHSLPLEQVELAWQKGKDFDYVYQIKETVRLVTKELGLDSKKNRIVYSSAIGKKWLMPDLCETVKGFGEEGLNRIITITPGFTADNLESLYDLDVEAKAVFLNSGGNEFDFVPCLNSEDYWVSGVIKIATSVL